MCVHRDVKVRGQHCVSSSVASVCFETGSLLFVKLSNSVILARQGLQGSPLSLLPWAGIAHA